jgi:hypothetical protein
LIVPSVKSLEKRRSSGSFVLASLALVLAVLSVSFAVAGALWPYFQSVLLAILFFLSVHSAVSNRALIKKSRELIRRQDRLEVLYGIREPGEPPMVEDEG